MARRSRKNRLPQEPVHASVESVSHDGKGICHVDDTTVFVDGALEGEDITFQYTSKRKKVAEAVVLEVIKASPLRVKPQCPHYEICGGCSLQHLDEPQQIHLKQQTLLDNLKHIGNAEPQQLLDPLVGPHWGYRRKARLGVRFVVKKDKLLVGFREKRSNFLAQLTACKVLHPMVGERLDGLSRLIHSLSIYDQIPQVEVAFGDEQGAYIIRHLKPMTDEDENKLKAYGEQTGLHIYLQPKGPDTIQLIWPQDTSGQFLPLAYYLPEYHIKHQFLPTDFTQVNAVINRQMIHLAMELLAPEAEDKVLDLFCGIGNFSLPLATRVKQVIAIEGNDELVARAKHNALANNIANVQFYAADLFKDFTSMQWAKQNYQRILLDPARSGAKEICEYLPSFKAHTVVYVSCNPATLARDTQIMVHKNGYKLVCAGVMDMFPHTAHVESIALFKK